MRTKTVVYSAWAIFAAMYISGAAVYSLGYRINHTPSVPIGLWRVSPVEGPLKSGEIISFCPTDTEAFQLARERRYIGKGKCPGNYEMLLKPVAAVEGDTVIVTDDGMSINGKAIPDSKPLSEDSKGRSLPRLRQAFVLKPGEVWLFSTYDARSYDSRYFGPVPVSQVMGIAAPIWLFK